jgi:hypothetical protein
MNRQQHIDMIRHLIEVEGFVPKDFFLTAPRAKDRARERERHRIAHIMKQCGLTAHDLSPQGFRASRRRRRRQRKKRKRAEKANAKWSTCQNTWAASSSRLLM